MKLNIVWFLEYLPYYLSYNSVDEFILSVVNDMTPDIDIRFSLRLAAAFCFIAIGMKSN